MDNYTKLLTGEPRDILAAMVPDSKRNYDLIYIDRYDQLTDDQITDYLNTGNTYRATENAWDWFTGYGYCDDAMFNAIEYYWPGLTDWCADTVDLRLHDRILNAARELVYVWDKSNPGNDMLRNTPAQLMQLRYTPDNYQVSTINLDDALEDWGLDMTDPDNKNAAEEIAANMPYGHHECYNLCILVYDEIDEYTPGATLTVTDPHIALIDYANGAAMDAQFTGDITVALTDDSPAVLDRTQGYGSAADICGLYEPAFRTSTTWSN